MAPVMNANLLCLQLIQIEQGVANEQQTGATIATALLSEMFMHSTLSFDQYLDKETLHRHEEV